VSRYKRHVFVCTNQRPAGHPKGCCASKGSEEVRTRMKEELKKRGLSRIVRGNAAGCLDACDHGVTLLVYPEGIWYGGVVPDDVPEIIDRTILRGEVIQRLVIPEPRFTPDAFQFRPLDFRADDIL
jgi:(2Fe-2S) ferredoxin